MSKLSSEKFTLISCFMTNKLFIIILISFQRKGAESASFTKIDRSHIQPLKVFVFLTWFDLELFLEAYFRKRKYAVVQCSYI